MPAIACGGRCGSVMGREICLARRTGQWRAQGRWGTAARTQLQASGVGRRRARQKRRCLALPLQCTRSLCCIAALSVWPVRVRGRWTMVGGGKPRYASWVMVRRGRRTLWRAVARTAEEG
jgi:hypothetical protein